MILNETIKNKMDELRIAIEEEYPTSFWGYKLIMLKYWDLVEEIENVG